MAKIPEALYAVARIETQNTTQNIRETILESANVSVLLGDGSSVADERSLRGGGGYGSRRQVVETVQRYR